MAPEVSVEELMFGKAEKMHKTKEESKVSSQMQGSDVSASGYLFFYSYQKLILEA